MNRVVFVLVIIVTLFVGGDRFAFAASRPIKQLPADVARWSLLWTVIPQEMIAVGQEHGPLAALVWGPAQGASAFIESAVKEVWSTVKPNKQRRPGSQSRFAKGTLFRYEF